LISAARRDATLFAGAMIADSERQAVQAKSDQTEACAEAAAIVDSALQ
jgi:hypothetical protein